jgi:gluconolactonase
MMIYGSKMIRRLSQALFLTVLATGAFAQEMPDGSKLVDDAVNFPEGPFYHNDKLYYVGLTGPGVLVWDGREKRLIYDDSRCGPTSVVVDDKHILVACYSGRYIAVLDPDGKKLEEISKDSDGTDLISPNDFTSDGEGGWYVTVTGREDDNYTHVEGKVYHIGSDLKLTRVADQIHYANGIAMSPDGKRLLIAEGEAQRIIAYDVDANHQLSNRRLFARLNKNDPEGGIDAYPDGIKFGPDGNLWVGEYTKPRIAILSGTDGSFVRGIDFPGNAATNLAFSPDRGVFAVTLVKDTVNEPWPGEVYEVPLPK